MASFNALSLIVFWTPHRKLPYSVNYAYFWFSLLFLISRTVTVFLLASGIHDASKEPAYVLRTVRTVDWSVEAERMLDQVNNDQIALSGKQFFYLTRKVLLAVSGLGVRICNRLGFYLGYS